VNVYFQPFMLGGAEWYVYNMSRQLVQRGHEVHVFTADNCNGTKAPPSEVMDGIIVHRLPLRIDWTYRLKVWQGLREAISSESFDIVHTYDYAQPHSPVAIRAGKERGAKTFLTVFDVHSMIPRVWYKQLPMRMMEGYMAKRTLPEAEKVLVRAPSLIDPLLRIGGIRERMVVTPSGIRDESLEAFDGQDFLRRHQVTGSPVILYLGRLNPLKGPQHLIGAASSILREFPNASFVFVGPDQSGYQDVLRVEAKRLGVDSRVHFLGPIFDFDEKMCAYAACDVFVLPTAYEGTSQAIFEAMSQSRPVVASRVGGVPCQVENGKEGFLVDYRDEVALASSILEILRDKSLATEMGRHGREVAEAHRYSLLAEQMNGLYEGVCRTS
jgi:glycosyltransferase involved in cell wall biosynthesis